MRIVLRTLVLLISIAILVVALLPPKNADTDNDVESLLKEPAEVVTAMPSPTPESPSETPAGTDGIVRDLLGGAQIDAGNKAKEVIGNVNEIRQRQIDGLEQDSP